MKIENDEEIENEVDELMKTTNLLQVHMTNLLQMMKIDDEDR